MKLVLATGNTGKVKELAAILSDLEVDILSLKDFPEITDIIEDGDTFEENALIKARTVCQAVNMISLADDSGLEVDHLNGAPGIYSARFAGEHKNDLDNNKKLLKLLSGVPEEERTARFKCVIAICLPGGESFTAEGTCEGLIGHEMKGENGFGYDSLFLVPEYGQTFAELDLDKKNKISHRAKALAEAKIVLSDILKRKRIHENRSSE